MSVWDRLKYVFGRYMRLEKDPVLGDSYALKRAFEKQRVGVTGPEPFPVANQEQLFNWHRRVGLVNACIGKIAESAQDPDLIVQRRKNMDSPWEPEPGHPLRRLLMRPNPRMFGAQFLGTWLSCLHISGEFFAEIERTKRGAPLHLWPLDPTKMKPLENGNWLWRDGGFEVELPAKDVFYSFFPDPQRPWLPLSPTAVALGPIETFALQTNFIRASFKNGGVPSGIIKVHNRRLTEEEAEGIRRRWIRRFGAASRDYAGPAVLDENADFEKIGANLSEIEGPALREMSDADICGIYGVPPLLVSAFIGLVRVNQRASALEAQKDFWANKMSPTFKWLRTDLTWSLLPEFEQEDEIFGETVRLNWDMSQVVALQEDIAAKDMRARESFRAGALRLDQYKSTMGLPFEQTDQYYLRRVNQIPITDDVVRKQLEAAAGVTGSAVSLVLTGSREPEEAVDDFDADDDAMSGAGPRARKSYKSYDWDGVECCREPTEFERKIDLRQTGLALKSGKTTIEAQLLIARTLLIRDAIEKLSALDPARYHELLLSFPLTTSMVLGDELTILFNRGRQLLADEVRKQGVSVPATEDVSAEQIERIDALSRITISRVLNDTQARASSLALHLAPLVADRDQLLQQVEQGLRDASTAFLSRVAAEATNAAIAYGREDEMAVLVKQGQPAVSAVVDDVEGRILVDLSGRPGTDRKQRKAEAAPVYIYTAVMDDETCRPCAAWDSVDSKKRSNLPGIPNPQCGDGYGMCRCQVTLVYF